MLRKLFFTTLLFCFNYITISQNCLLQVPEDPCLIKSCFLTTDANSPIYHIYPLPCSQTIPSSATTIPVIVDNGNIPAINTDFGTLQVESNIKSTQPNKKKTVPIIVQFTQHPNLHVVTFFILIFICFKLI